jgi:hypothetical protein
MTGEELEMNGTSLIHRKPVNYVHLIEVEASTNTITELPNTTTATEARSSFATTTNKQLAKVRAFAPA